MDLQKVKEALKANLDALCSLDKNQFGDVIIDGRPSHPVMVELVGRTREALAELEKPVDDTSECAGSVLALFANGGNIGYVLDKVKTEIQQYAESYHDKKCAECSRKERKYHPLGQEIVHIGCETCGHYDESKERCGATDEQWATITDRDCNKENNYAHYIDLA